MNDIVKNTSVTTTGKDSKAPEEMLVDPQAYEQFLAALTQEKQKFNLQLTDGLQGKRENSELMHNLQQEINSFTAQFDEFLEQAPTPDSLASLPIMTEQLQALMSQLFPEFEATVSPLKAMQDKLKETNSQLENNLITPKEAQSVLTEAQQLLNNTMIQLDQLLKNPPSSATNSQVPSSSTQGKSDNGVVATGENDVPLATNASSLPKSDSSTQNTSSNVSGASYSGSSGYDYDLISLNDNYSMFLLAFWIFSEMADVVSDSSALVANLLSMNTGYADQTNDDMMAYNAIQAVVPYEYTDANGNKVTTDDPYIIYSIMAISTPGNAAYDPESSYFDEDLAQKGAGFYTYMQEHYPDIAVYDPTEINTALNVYDKDTTQAVCEAYNDMAKAMEELNNNIKYCANHLESNDPVLDWPETEEKPPAGGSYTKISLDTDVINENSDTMTSLQSLATQLSEDLQMQLNALLETLQECYKSAKSEISAYASVAGAIATGQ